MARSLSEIYTAIVTEKNSQTSLQGLAPQADSLDNFGQDLNNDRKVAVWRIFAYLVALAIWTHELLWDQFKVELQEIVDAAPTGTVEWYQQQTLAYQYGYNLTYQNNKYVYSITDPSSQIVKLCAVTERVGSTLIIKVANLDASDLPLPLTTIEQNALFGYLQKIKFAGTRIAVISDDADLLKIIGEIYYDPIIPLPDLRINVEAAIVDYIRNLPFNGVFKITGLIDTIQAVEGVTDAVLPTIETKYGALPYVAVNRIYTANAGHLDIDPAFPLSTNLSYNPSIA